MKLILYLVAGIILTLITHLLGAHDGLAHMQYGDQYGWYIVESLLYSLIICLIINLMTNHD